MPVISKFYGIVIRIFFKQMFEAHFHAICGDNEIMVGIAPVRIINGEAPERVRGMVLEWAAQHQRELLQAWNQCRLARAPLQIAPLA